MTGFIYAIECAGRIKLGYSVNPERRLDKIGSDAPFPCTLLGCWPGSGADESTIHERFKHLREKGEWFAATEEITNFVHSSIVQRGKVRKIITENPVAEVINKLGGSAEVSKLVGVGVAAVSMAKKRKHFPHSWRMKIWQETKRRDLQIAPKLIGMDEGAAA